MFRELNGKKELLCHLRLMNQRARILREDLLSRQRLGLLSQSQALFVGYIA